ncbi:hypothetical protein BG015_009758 [Linnemannia schmuckeri]|uniref:Uncharacterized protein n=1 Tax=Linnemannia schmuckeri TaxID=64567 RepID=A0A9P5S7N6_9FUNG|nr:hypothetical protein BG015_009758 [Linnemannia schmuckeri]
MVPDLQVQERVKTAVAQERTTSSTEKPLTSQPAHQWHHDIHALLSSRSRSPIFIDVQKAYSQDGAGSIQPETDIFEATEMAVDQERMDLAHQDDQLEDEPSRQPSPSYASPVVYNKGDSSDENSHTGGDLDNDPQETEASQACKVFMEYESIGMIKGNKADQHEFKDLESSATNAIEASDCVRIQENGSVERESEGSKSPPMDTAQPPIASTEVQGHSAQDEYTGLGLLTNDIARVSINATGHSQHSNNNAEQLRQVIRALTARVASLEQEKKQKLEAARRQRPQYGLLPTPEPPSATSTHVSVETVFQDKKSNRVTATAIDEVDRHRQENQALRDKLAYLERENRVLAERSLQLQIQDQPFNETRPTIAMATAAAYCHFNPVNVVRVRDNEANRQNNHKDDIEDPDGLQQEILDLRAQLTAKKQEKNASLDYTMASIESEEFLDTKMAQMEQSMHGLWTMMANNEALRFATVPTDLGPMQQQPQQHQRQQQVQDRHYRLRLRVDAMRRRIASNGYHRP